MNKPNISDIHNCYGCGVCSKPCPLHIIDLHLNSEGFYEPYLTEPDKCIHCGLCREVCAFIKDKPAYDNPPIISYAAWSNDKQVQRKCSSGGVGFEIARCLLDKGYKTIGVRYNPETERAEHFISTTIEELVQTIGSKYIQSYPVDGWKDIDRKGKYLVTGTPCQIDSFRNYMKRINLPANNFVLLDFFCHGVPSMLVWQKYCKEVEKKVGKITYASWRNKWNYGWHDSWAMGIDGEKHGKRVNWHDSYNMLIREKKTFIQSRLSQGDMFYTLFLGDCCLGKQCYKHCKYKYDHSSADIRIGDLWGNTYKDNEDGVSAAISFTKKGHEILKACNCELINHPFEVVAEGQQKRCAKCNYLIRKCVMAFLKKDNLNMAYRTARFHNKLRQLINRLSHPIRSVKKLFAKLK